MSILEMSASGAVMILVVVLTRALTINRLPKKTFLTLWGVTLARLLVPYSLPSAFSVYSLAGGLAPPAKAGPLATGGPAVQPAGLPGPGSGVPSPAVPGVSDGIPIIEPYMLVWLAGVLACAVFFAVVYVKCRREFREALPVDNRFALDWLKAHPLRRTIRLRRSDRVSAPLTYGVFRPVILLPKHTDWGDETTLAYVLTHEYVHIRRFDAVTKLALAAALCVHWFNPAVWAMYLLANRDLELSCDETVIRLLGDRSKSAYAMALIRMEETRSGLRPLCNNFSKHAIEERILAIMKTKKTTWFTAVAALALIFCVTTAFATSARTQGAGQDREELDRTLNAQTGTVYIDSTLMSYTDPRDGKTYYSWDEGGTWTPLSEEELEALDPSSQVEWWTAEEYKVWLEQEKPGLQSIIGSQGWTPSTGWFTWTQEMVDETIARYEDTLRDIENGMMVSKAVYNENGNETQVMMSCDPRDIKMGTESGITEPTTEELLAEYGTFGISFDASGKMLYQGKPVRWFADFVELEEGAFATRYVYRNDEGTEYIHTVRSRIDNGDGSYDPFGPLVEIVPWETGVRDDFGFLFQGDPIEVTTEIIGSYDAGGTTFAERFAKYKDFGITYVEADGASGCGNVYWNGQLVSHFADVAPNGGAFTFTSGEQGGINVQAVYDGSGNLTGLKSVTD